ncbi:hypothetical protein JGH11_19225, partial [Dysgonomonas sp. Marseille-P4677]|nr:hypothetical protein [Dysgonomonas sp. Marseille-P4677]
MEQTHYKKYFDAYLDGVLLSTINKLNGEENPAQPRYRFKTMLSPQFSMDGKWKSVINNYQHVKADIVSYNSPLPLKSRPSLEVASGKIPKSGMRKKIEEDELTALQDMEGLGLAEEVKSVLFGDTVSCIYGMYENLEYLHLLGLSSGIALVTEENNVGTATRLNFGYLEENKFGVAFDWNNPVTSKPLDDIEKMVDKSEGAIRILMMDRPTANKLRNSYQVRRDVAASSGAVVIDASVARRPSVAELNDFLTTEYN